jgi:allophanate hydrolase
VGDLATRDASLGFFTRYTNLLDLAAVAVPAGFTARGLPFGITISADAWSDSLLLDLAGRFHRRAALRLGATDTTLSPEIPVSALPSGHVAVAVCGGHMEGLSLNRQLTERGAFLLERTRTSRHYRLYALPGGPPFRPGLARTEQGGQAIEVEVWAVPLPAYGSFVASLARPLAIGAVELQDGSHVQGCLCEHHALRGARDISDLGGWRAYLATLAV